MHFMEVLTNSESCGKRAQLEIPCKKQSEKVTSKLARCVPQCRDFVILPMFGFVRHPPTKTVRLEEKVDENVREAADRYFGIRIWLCESNLLGKNERKTLSWSLRQTGISVLLYRRL